VIFLVLKKVLNWFIAVDLDLNPTFSDFDENWHTESSWPNSILLCFLKPPGDAPKCYRVSNFSFSIKEGIIFYVPTQWVFVVKISVWMRSKGIFTSKIKKHPTTIFFKNNFFFGWLENCSKNEIFKNLKKISTKQQLYNAHLLKATFPDFLKMAASEILIVFLG
jgi:hypothetical protein